MKIGIYALNPQSFPISQDLGSKSVFFQTSDLSAWFYNTNYSPWHVFRLLICQKTVNFNSHLFERSKGQPEKLPLLNSLSTLLLGNKECNGVGQDFFPMSVVPIREPRTELYIVILVNQHKIQNVRIRFVRIQLKLVSAIRSNRMESSFWMEGLAGVETRVFANIVRWSHT